MKHGDSLPAGTLNLLISLYAPTQTGDEVTGETLIKANVPASKRSIPGASRESTQVGREVARQFAIFAIRYRTGIDTVTFLTYGTERWDIDFVDNINGSNRVLELTARRSQ